MGLKNAPSIFQRMMEYVLQEHKDFVDPYIDDVIIGTTSENSEDLVKKHFADVRKVLLNLANYEILVNPKKVQMFMRKVEFCGHILTEGKRSPAPGKMVALQKWELPKTVTQLRAFLGVINYYSGYLQGYAGYAAPPPLLRSFNLTGRMVTRVTKGIKVDGQGNKSI